MSILVVRPNIAGVVFATGICIASSSSSIRAEVVCHEEVEVVDVSGCGLDDIWAAGSEPKAISFSCDDLKTAIERNGPLITNFLQSWDAVTLVKDSKVCEALEIGPEVVKAILRSEDLTRAKQKVDVEGKCKSRFHRLAAPEKTLDAEERLLNQINEDPSVHLIVNLLRRTDLNKCEKFFLSWRTNEIAQSFKRIDDSKGIVGQLREAAIETNLPFIDKFDGIKQGRTGFESTRGGIGGEGAAPRLASDPTLRSVSRRIPLAPSTTLHVNHSASAKNDRHQSVEGVPPSQTVGFVSKSLSPPEVDGPSTPTDSRRSGSCSLPRMGEALYSAPLSSRHYDEHGLSTTTTIDDCHSTQSFALGVRRSLLNHSLEADHDTTDTPHTGASQRSPRRVHFARTLPSGDPVQFMTASLRKSPTKTCRRLSLSLNASCGLRSASSRSGATDSSSQAHPARTDDQRAASALHDVEDEISASWKQVDDVVRSCASLGVHLDPSWIGDCSNLVRLLDQLPRHSGPLSMIKFAAYVWRARRLLEDSFIVDPLVNRVYLWGVIDLESVTYASRLSESVWPRRRMFIHDLLGHDSTTKGSFIRDRVRYYLTANTGIVAARDRGVPVGGDKPIHDESCGDRLDKDDDKELKTLVDLLNGACRGVAGGVPNADVPTHASNSRSRASNAGRGE